MIPIQLLGLSDSVIRQQKHPSSKLATNRQQQNHNRNGSGNNGPSNSFKPSQQQQQNSGSKQSSTISSQQQPNLLLASALSQSSKPSSSETSSNLTAATGTSGLVQQAVAGRGGSGVDTLKESVHFGMNFLKRRFSSSDLDDDEDVQIMTTGQQTAAAVNGQSNYQQSGVGGVGHHNQQQIHSNPSGGGRQPPPHQPPRSGYGGGHYRPDSSGFNLTGLTNQKMSSTISAPASPAKSQGSMYSQVQGLTRNLFQGVQAATGVQLPGAQHSKTLLVIDDHHTDWSKYFKSKKILNDWDIRVEQAEFSEISLASSTESGCSVDINSSKSGQKITRSLQPDFVLIRQPVKTADADWRKIVIGLLYGGVPSLNSLHSIYNFIDKPWVFANLLMIQKRMGREKFPLIEQAYYPTFREMCSSGKFPIVIKVGHGQKGMGKMKVKDPAEFDDVRSVIGVTGEHCTAEPRKGISGHWKANMGSSMLEQIAMTDRYKSWIDEIAALFGGLDMCSVEGVVGKDGMEVIYEANDSSFPLLGETQEEDRRTIAELVMNKMNHILGIRQALQHNGSRRESSGGPISTSVGPTSAAPGVPADVGRGGIGNFIKHEATSYSAQPSPSNRPSNRPQPPPPPPSATSSNSTTNPFVSNGPASTTAPASSSSSRGPPPPRPTRQPSKDNTKPFPPPIATTNNGGGSSGDPTQTSTNGPPSAGGGGNGGGGEDTMGNLRKTFAGIFGDM